MMSLRPFSTLANPSLLGVCSCLLVLNYIGLGETVMGAELRGTLFDVERAGGVKVRKHSRELHRGSSKELEDLRWSRRGDKGCSSVQRA